MTGKWDSIKLLGAVSDAGETFFLPREEKFNSDTTIRLLDSLQTEFGEKICVVLDNVSYFTANAVQEFVKDTPIELCYLPRGSPELNPTESAGENSTKRSETDCLCLLTSCRMPLSQHSKILSLHNSLRIYVCEYKSANSSASPHLRQREFYSHPGPCVVRVGNSLSSEPRAVLLYA